MTLKEKLEEFCINRGLLPYQAEAVVKSCMDEAKSDMKCTSNMWEDEIENITLEELGVLCLKTKRHALQWIEQNNLMHGSRQLFTG